MKTDGEKKTNGNTVKFSYWLILLLFCTKKQNNKKRLFVSIIWGGAVEGIKIIIPNLQSAPPHYTIISAVSRHLGGGV